MPRRILISTALAALVALAGCVYVPPVTQGNYLQYSALQKLKVGMTRDQVQFLFGPPQLANPFYPDTWHYVYYYKRGSGYAHHTYRLTVNFENGKVSRFKTSKPLAKAPDAPDTASAETPAQPPSTLPRHPIGKKRGNPAQPQPGRGGGH